MSKSVMTIGRSMAWRQLVKEKRRLMAALAGIAFAVILMLVQLGFEQALFKSVGLLYRRMNAELVLISPKYRNANSNSPFTLRRLDQAMGVREVEWAAPMYLSGAPWTNPVDHIQRDIFIIAIPPQAGILDLPGVNAHIAELRRPSTVLFDSSSRPEFGPIADLLTHGPLSVEFSGVTARVGGTFQLGTSFANDGNLITSDANLKTWKADRDPSLMDIGMIKLKAGSDPQIVRKELQAILPNDVLVLTREELLEREETFWASSTPIGFVFRLGLLMGLIVGSVVVYQILYNDVSEHLAEYATLKAMGYTDRFLFGLVIQESLILSILGFLPGLVLSQVVYTIAYRATLLPLRMDPIRVTVVYLLTAGMCVFSGALAMRRLRLADPAEIF
ncbi:FtsX-like permease family protein [Terriglobus albidus]|uniref:FtsX-like permease family protein n=2 Tax=Terriglobus albidus TaxID=1592106 RepID=A0A5B9EIU0_9BACT|nr:FtsX-like permease family protein [Terriglobus albidus]